RAGRLKRQVRDKKPGKTVRMTAPIPAVRARPWIQGPGTRDARTHSGRRRPGIAHRSAYALVTGTGLDQERRAVKTTPLLSSAHAPERAVPCASAQGLRAAAGRADRQFRRVLTRVPPGERR